jgi:hypothetical protein
MSDLPPRNAADQGFDWKVTSDERGKLDDSYFKLPEKIAFITWGALAWDPGELPLVSDDPEHPEQAWQPGGPELPIEFSRVAVDCRLIPVIDPEHGKTVTTLYARSRRNDLDAAVHDLMKAEGATNPKRIGYVDVRDGKHRCRIQPALAEVVKEWARAHEFDAVIWTELPSNFKDHTGRDFSPETAVKYLGELPKVLVDQAKEYVDRAPAEIETPLRAKLREEGWPV